MVHYGAMIEAFQVKEAVDKQFQESKLTRFSHSEVQKDFSACVGKGKGEYVRALVFVPPLSI